MDRNRDEDAERRRVALAEARDRRPDDEHLPQRDHHADRGEARADHRRRPAELRAAIEAPRHRIDAAGDLPPYAHPPPPPPSPQRAHLLPPPPPSGWPPLT